MQRETLLLTYWLSYQFSNQVTLTTSNIKNDNFDTAKHNTDFKFMIIQCYISHYIDTMNRFYLNIIV